MDEQGERGGGRVSTRPVLTEAEAEILALSLAFARECREGLAASDGFLEAELLDGARAEGSRLQYAAGSLALYLRLRRGDLALRDEPFDLAALTRSCAAIAARQLPGYVRFGELELPPTELRNDIEAMHRLLYALVAHAAALARGRPISLKLRSDRFLAYLELSLPLDGSDEASVPYALPFAVELSARLARILGGGLDYERAAGEERFKLVFPLSMHWRASVGDASAGDAAAGAGASLAAPSAAPERSAAPPPPPAEARAAGSETILVVDADDASRRRVAELLASAGYAVSSPAAPPPLERPAREAPWDAVVASARIRGEEGLDFCRGLRAAYPDRILPVLMVVDSARAEDLKEALDAGASDYLVRPVGAAELLLRLRGQLALARALREERERRERTAEHDKLRTLGMLSAGVAHEINTPNNAVLRGVPMLKEIWRELAPAIERVARAEPDFRIRGFSYDDLAAELPSMLDDLLMGAQHIRRIVAELKDYASRPEGEAGAVDLNEALRYAMRLLRHEARLVGAAFADELDPELPKVRGDRMKLAQVFVNLIENALQALKGRGGAVVVRSSLEDGLVSAQIIDDGEGMDEETLGKACDPFFTTRRRSGGSGLGLSVCAGILREAGADFRLTSTLGRGTTASVRFKPYYGRPGAESEANDG